MTNHNLEEVTVNKSSQEVLKQNLALQHKSKENQN